MKKENTKNYLSKEEVQVLKGFAIIFMFIHHFFTFPEWHAEYIDCLLYTSDAADDV